MYIYTSVKNITNCYCCVNKFSKISTKFNGSKWFSNYFFIVLNNKGTYADLCSSTIYLQSVQLYTYKKLYKEYGPQAQLSSISTQRPSYSEKSDIFYLSIDLHWNNCHIYHKFLVPFTYPETEFGLCLVHSPFPLIQRRNYTLYICICIYKFIGLIWYYTYLI